MKVTKGHFYVYFNLNLCSYGQLLSKKLEILTLKFGFEFEFGLLHRFDNISPQFRNPIIRSFVDSHISGGSVPP